LDRVEEKYSEIVAANWLMTINKANRRYLAHPLIEELLYYVSVRFMADNEETFVLTVR
jgi:hypothetical protein